ncbi:hypothetical protein [Thermococcus barophilus]|uniref:Uncharacterized protein n=1 Tax=Thermococcus barophilus TaxID=55802 RepID=A0A0S1X8X9_THEBA|nr:hypothetical protein [Thermococcus barophilus]ALM74216.1 hypothetical protein TBCH5v1_0238 [Thermococcus barophilus]
MGMKEVEDVKKALSPIVEESREEHGDAVLNFSQSLVETYKFFRALFE